tara:strand:- start:83 stop:481 length:399 start_codon:yes stop_codon:yes gene_type:complete
MQKYRLILFLFCFILTISLIFVGKISRNLDNLNSKFFKEIFIENGNAFINLDNRIEKITKFILDNNFVNYSLHFSLEKNPNISHRVTEILWPIRRKNTSKNLIIIKDEISKNDLNCKIINKISSEIFYCKLK